MSFAQIRLVTLFSVFVWMLFACGIVNPVVAVDWPTYRFDNARGGATTEELPASLVEKWRFRSPCPPRRAWAGPEGRTIEGKVLKDRVRFDDAFQPVVVGRRVFFGSTADHQLRCLDLATGNVVWTFFSGAPIRLAPTVANDRVYFGSDDGYAYCLDVGNGKVIWKSRPGPAEEWILGRGEMISRWAIRTGVTIDNGVAYFGAGIFPHEDVYLHAVNAETGKPIWIRDDISEADAGRDDLSPQGYLLTSDDLLFVPSGRSMPATFNRQTGDLLHKKTYSWRSTAGGVVGGTRALLADGQIYSGGAHHLLAIDQKSGNVGFGWFDGRQMVVAGDDAYIATGSAVAKLDRLKYAANSAKRHQLEMDIYSHNRSLRSAKGDKAKEIRDKIKAAQEEDAKLADIGITWQVESQADQSMIVAGETLLVGGDGVLEGYHTGTHNKHFELSFDGLVRGLVAANGYLVVSTTTGDVVGFGAGEVKDKPIKPVAKKTNPYPDDEITALCRKAAGEALKIAEVDRGFALVVGSEDGRLAYELARQSKMRIYGIEPDASKVAESRRLLARAGVYGSRVTIHHAESDQIPYSNYFANLIVSDTHLRTATLPGDAKRILQHLKPLGGVAWFSTGKPDPAGQLVSGAGSWLTSGGLDGQSLIKVTDSVAMLTRSKLPGAGDWSHQYGNVGNTAIINDTRVKGDLGVLWYGDPGPGEMVNRHEGAVGPLSVNGRMFVQGEATILAYDAYNGQFLWKYENKEALRTGVFQNQNPGNLAASKDRLFHFLKDECFELDAATGEVVRIHRLPKKLDDNTREWGYVAFNEGLLIGTATVRKELESRLRRRGRKVDDATDAIFAIDTKTGDHKWSYSGGSISHRTIALGPGKVCFIDSTITGEQRAQILRENKTELAALEGEARQIAEDRMKKLDARVAVALEAGTGKELWSHPVDVTDCSEIGTGGGKLTMMLQGDTLILCGANANGHYWKQFIAGEFKRRRLVALSAEDGYTLWKKDADYRHRPIIIGDKVLAEPWMFDLKSGEQIMKQHPLTGRDVPWSIIRPGHHCGMLTGCDNMLMFRSGYTGFFDLESEEGTRHFAGHRLGCWINAIPANGLVMIPEASAGCVCQFSIASTIVLEPRQARRPWTLISATGAQLPVKKMSLNFGAPGDRKAADGTVWLAYPRINPKKVTSLDLAFDLKPKFHSGGKFDSVNARTQSLLGTSTPWLYTSWADNLSELTLPLRGEKDPPSTYELKLHFAAVGKEQSQGTFRVEIDGKPVLAEVEPRYGKDGSPVAFTASIPSVSVEKNVTLRFVPNGKDGTPILNALEVRELPAVAGGD